MNEKMYYISCNDRGYEKPDYRQWLLPENNEPGDRINVGEDPYSSIILRTLKGILYDCKLDALLFRAQYRGLQLVPYLSKDHSSYVETGDIFVREARLLYLVESWKPSTGMNFACRCTERAFDSALDIPTDACQKALDYGRKRYEGYVHLERWADEKGHDLKDVGMLVRVYEYDTGEKILPSDELWELEKHIRKELEEGKVGPYAGKAALALCNNFPDFAANYAAKNACYAKDRLAWSEHGAYKLTTASASKLEEAKLAMKKAWIKELDWQAEYLASLINDTENISNHF